MVSQGKTAAALLCLCSVASLLRAQEPVLPTAPEPSRFPVASPTPPIVVPTPLPNLVPAPLPTVPPVPGRAQLDDAFKKSPMGQVAEEYRLHIAWRELQNDAARDPGVIAAKQAAMAARTDLEKRKRLRIYYETYYGRMKAKASTPEIKAYVEAQRLGHLGTTAQDHVRPGGTPSAKSERR